MTAGSTFRLPAQCLGCSHLITESADICKSEGLSDLWDQLRAERGASAGYSPPGAPKTVLTGTASPRPAFPSLVCKGKETSKGRNSTRRWRFKVQPDLCSVQA